MSFDYSRKADFQFTARMTWLASTIAQAGAPISSPKFSTLRRVTMAEGFAAADHERSLGVDRSGLHADDRAVDPVSPLVARRAPSPCNHTT
jgi:hypothetical protein